MSNFAALFAGLMSSLASFFGLWLSKKAALGVAAVALFASLTGAFMVVMALAIQGVLTYATLPEAVVLGFWYFMPDNFVACVSAIVAADVASAIYVWNVQNLKLMAYIT